MSKKVKETTVVVSRSKRGMPLNKNGAIIRNLVGDAKHNSTLMNEFIAQRSPKKAKSFSDEQERVRKNNVYDASIFNIRYPKRKSKTRK